jgi:hypothetical protein
MLEILAKIFLYNSTALTLKSSKPNISNIEIAAVCFVPLHTIWLMRDTSHENKALYKALAKASRASRA